MRALHESERATSISWDQCGIAARGDIPRALLELGSCLTPELSACGQVSPWHILRQQTVTIEARARQRRAQRDKPADEAPGAMFDLLTPVFTLSRSCPARQRNLSSPAGIGNSVASRSLNSRVLRAICEKSHGLANIVCVWGIVALRERFRFTAINHRFTQPCTRTVFDTHASVPTTGRLLRCVGKLIVMCRVFRTCARPSTMFMNERIWSRLG